MPNQRQQLTTEDFEAAKAELSAMLSFRMKQKGMGVMSSNDEILGAIYREFTEYYESVQERLSDEEKVHELLDIAVAALWGIASIRSGGIDY